MDSNETSGIASISAESVTEPVAADVFIQPSEQEIVRPETLRESADNNKLFKLCKFLTSSLFIYLVYGIMFFIHLLIYIGIGVGDYFTFINGGYNNVVDKKQASFVIDTFVFSTQGCGTGSKNFYVLLTFLIFYTVLAVGFGFVALLMKRDLWKVKMEIALTSINWVFFGLAYGIPNLRSEITTL